MRVLVLGAGGMLGHRLIRNLGREFEIAGTVRGDRPAGEVRAALPDEPLIANVTAEDAGSAARAIEQWRADVVINCIGIVKQSDEAREAVPSIVVNALFPHQLAELARQRGARLIHFSTDCVFSGTRGDYREDDNPDPVDLYGRTKLLGEVSGSGVVTLRTSIIGRELRGRLGLVEWFLSQRGGRVSGYAGAHYSGLTTGAMADVVSLVIRSHADLEGVWQVSADPITKFDLLQIVNRVYQLGVTIDRDAAFFCDRRLNSARFREQTGWRPPTWDAMIEDMYAEGPP